MKIIENIKEYKINTATRSEPRLNEPFIINGHKCKAILREPLKCSDCVFYGFALVLECRSLHCQWNKREDGNDVIFLYIYYENNKKNKFKKWFWSLFNRG